MANSQLDRGGLLSTGASRLLGFLAESICLNAASPFSNVVFAKSGGVSLLMFVFTVFSHLDVICDTGSPPFSIPVSSCKIHFEHTSSCGFNV